MDKLPLGNMAHGAQGQPADIGQAIATLRSLGADRFDPIGLQFLEILARRTASQNPAVKCILELKLSLALQDFEQRFRQAHCDANDAVANLASSGKPASSWSDLTLHLEQHSLKHNEFKSVRQFRDTWSKHSAVRQVTRALEKGPKNAGPINSHMLVLRSLVLMRDISPDYLSRFVSYVDTLMSLESDAASRLPVTVPKPLQPRRAQIPKVRPISKKLPIDSKKSS
jgi:hypothetical protein